MAERPQYPDSFNNSDVSESMKRLDAEHAVPSSPEPRDSTPGSGVPVAQGMHGMFDGKSPHAANHANADATAVEAQTGKRPKPAE